MHAMFSGSGLFVLPLTLAAGAAALIASSAPASPDGGVAGGELVEMEVLGVVPLDGEQSSMLVLEAKGAKTILPLVIGQAEALAIELRLRHAAAPRPLTHDLLEHTIEALGGRVVGVEIARLKDAVFEARIRLVQGSSTLVIDARPSDSIALALHSRAPIYAQRKVLDDAGLTKGDIERLRRGRAGNRPETGQPGPSRTL